MRLTRPFVTLDAETTGTSTDTDRIIELAAIRLQPDGHKRMKVWKLNPGIPISPGATEVHGLKIGPGYSNLVYFQRAVARLNLLNL